MARNYHSVPKWMQGVVIECTGPLSYVVQMDSGQLSRRHVDQLRDGIEIATEWDIPEVEEDVLMAPMTINTPSDSGETVTEPPAGPDDRTSSRDSNGAVCTSGTTDRRYPS